MSEVKQILGPPDFDDKGEGRNHMGQSVSEGGTLRMWVWEKKNDRMAIRVEFKNGRLTVAKGDFGNKYVDFKKPGEAVVKQPVGGNPLAAQRPPAGGMPPAGQRPPGQRPPVADPLAEFGVRVGMTEAELVAKLGQPDEAKDLPGRRDLNWFKGKRVVGVVLIKGKVSGRSLSYRP